MMRSYLRLQGFFVFGIFLTVGCSDVAQRDTAPLEIVVDGVDGRVEGSEVCEGEAGNCALSDINGEVTLEVPVGEEIFYTFRKDGYDSLLFAGVVPEDGASSNVYMQRESEITPLYEELMSAYPRLGTGQIQIFLEPQLAGVTFDLINATGKRYYEPFPWDPPPYTDPGLEATSDTGAGGFVELTPGTVQVRFGGAADRCVPAAAWPGEVENEFRIPVQANHNSIVVVQCPVPQLVVLGGAP